jgi:hypothetical protein
MKWNIHGYYFDGQQEWTILINDDGKTKTVKGIK